MAGIFDMIGVEIQYFQELKTKPETSERDLDYGRGQVWEEAQIWDKKWDSVGDWRITDGGDKKRLKIENSPNDHYQNVDLGLNFLLEAPESKNNHSQTKNIRKL